VRIAVYTDYTYRRDGSTYYAERAFARFMCALRPFSERLVLVGRLRPQEGTSHYRIPADVEVLGLPHYETLARPHEAVVALARSLRSFWRALDEIDAVWLLGPYLHALAFLVIARLRGRRVVLGVRQDTPAYVRARYPRRPLLRAAGLVLDRLWRLAARRYPVVVVGPHLAQSYERAAEVLPVVVSLVGEDEVGVPEDAERRSYDGELTLLTVGRIDREKNPLLLVDVLAALRARDPRWRLEVYGEGPMRDELEAALADAGLAEAAALRGYVAVDEGLAGAYRAGHVFLHVSWTEGLPQVLFEAFAAALPVVATDVGGVAAGAGDAALLIGPGDAAAAVEAVARVAEDAELRRRLVAAGIERVRAHTLEVEARRVAQLLAG